MALSESKSFILVLLLTLDMDLPSTTVTATKEELIGYFKDMYTMRRMEITNDTEYKVGGRTYREFKIYMTNNHFILEST